MMKKNELIRSGNFFTKMFVGQSSEFSSVAIYDYHFVGPDIVIEEYTAIHLTREIKFHTILRIV